MNHPNLIRNYLQSLSRRIGPIHWLAPLTRPIGISCCKMTGDKPSNGQVGGQDDNSVNEKKPNLEKLSSMQYKVTQEKYTEMPFTGRFNKFKKLGTFQCVVCGSPLFKSEHKFDSGCGWPAFYDSIEPGRVKEVVDESHGMNRIEVLCAKCDAHLGHVFNDGPKPTRRRFCINSVSMKFIDPSGSVEQDPGE